MVVSTGTDGLDALLGGGLPEGAAVVLQGPSGEEKYRLGLQFVATGLRAGEAVVVVVSSLSPQRLLQDLAGRGTDTETALAEGRLRIIDWHSHREERVTSIEEQGSITRCSTDITNVSVALGRALAALPEALKVRALLEILSPALQAYDAKTVYHFATSTKAKLERYDAAALFLVEREMHDAKVLSSLHQPFDGVIDIERDRQGDAIVRKLAVLSLKGAAKEARYHPLHIDPAGKVVVGGEAPAQGKDARFWLGLGRTLMDAGDAAGALRYFGAAVREDPQSEEARRYWHLAQDRLAAKATAAPESVDEAPCPTCGTKLRPEDEFCYGCGASRKERRPERSLAVLQRTNEILAQRPQDADAWFAKAVALATLGNTQGAVESLNELAKVAPKYPGLWFLKARVYEMAGDNEKAKLSLQRALAIVAQERPPPTPAAEPPKTPSPLPPPPPPPWPPPPPPKRPDLTTQPAPPTRVPADTSLTNGNVPAKPGFTNGLVNGLRAKTRGHVNGLVNGTRGRTNGLTNGMRGRTNGLVNGTRGRTNGLVNGTRGRTNGLVNGTRGRTNGMTTGLVNGLASARLGLTNGLTNGSGFTNGLSSQRFARSMLRSRWKVLLIPVTFAALLAMPLLVPDLPRWGPRIDGNFDDWGGVPALALAPGTNDTNVALTRVALVNETDRLSLLVEVQGRMLGGTPGGAQDTIFVFVDRDRDSGTGYPIDGLGADRLLEVQGNDGAVTRALVYRFSESVADRRDWRGWTDPGYITAAVNGSRLEVSVTWLALEEGGGNPVFLVAALGGSGATDLADLHVGTRPGHLRVTHRHVPPLLLAGANVPLLEIELEAVDADVSVSGVTTDLLGTAPPSTIGLLQLIDATGTPIAQRVPVDRRVAFTFPAVTVTAGYPVRWTVAASVFGAGGETLGAGIPDAEAVEAGSSVVTLRTSGSGERLGYVGQLPSAAAVDGAFAEWTNDTADAGNETGIGSNPTIDLDSFGANVGANDVTFHVGLRGPAFAGTVLTTRPPIATPYLFPPADRDRDSVPDAEDPLPDDFNNDGVPDAQAGGDHDGDGLVEVTFGGIDVWLNTTVPAAFPPPYAGRNVSRYIGPTTAPPAVGEDYARLFVDVDNVSATGYYLAGIGADYLVEISGREGLVSSARLLAHAGATPGTWNWTTVGGVPVAVGLVEFEASASIAAWVPSPAMYLEMSDWRGGLDTLGVGSRSLTTRSVPVFSGPEVSFVPTSGGDFAYRSAGTNLEAFVRAQRGIEEELLLRHGSLFLAWRTEALRGVRLDASVAGSDTVRAAGRSFVVGGFEDAWEQYELGENRLKHNVWMASAPMTGTETVSLEGILRIPEGGEVRIDGRTWQGTFTTEEEIVVAHDGYGVRLEPPFAYESRHPLIRTPGRFTGEVFESYVRLSMEVSAAWLRDEVRVYPVVLDPSATGITDTSTGSAATHGPSERNIFHDGTNFWAFYYDGTTIQYEPSSNGLDWVNTKATAFTTGGVQKVSTWYHDAATDIVYVVGDTGSGTAVLVRRGTISGTTISWGTETSLTISAQSEAKRPFIARDTAGYIWVASNNKEGGGQWNFAAVRSTSTDNVSAWGSYTNLLTASIGNANIQGVIVPLGSGELYALWYANGAVDGKKYSGSWGSLETIDTTSTGTLTKAPSATVDGSFNIHLVYSNSTGVVMYRQRTSSWGSPTTLDSNSGNTYPTISRDTGTGDLYAFWIASTNQIKGKKYSGSWSDVTVETNTKAKTTLTSIYNVSASGNVAWAWTQGSASPYDIKFSLLSTTLGSRTIDTSTDSTPVTHTHQRKVFFDGSYWWAFYYDGTNAVYTYSSAAETWEETVSQGFTTSGVDNPSVWYHDGGATKIVYLVGDGTTNDATVIVRRGTISGTTISWGSENTVTMSSSPIASKVAFITRDSSGYLWIVSNNKPTSSTHNVGVARSTNPDDVTAWGSATNLMNTSISNSNIYPTILPQSGGNMYAFWYADGAIDGKRYTGSWGSLESIATTTAAVTTKVPSGVVDGSDNIHLAYINSTGAVLYVQRTGSWGSPTTLDSNSGNVYPTITRETSTGDLYALWIASTNQIKGKKYSGSWSDVTGIDTSTVTKGYVTSPYNVNADYWVAWLWGQGGTSPYEVKMARIPEFGQLAIPLASLLGLFIGLGTRRRRTSHRASA